MHLNKSWLSHIGKESIFTSEEGGSIFPRNVCIYEQLYNGIATQETNMDAIQSRSLGSSGMYHRAVNF
jgi:hypothetical protein